MPVNLLSAGGGTTTLTTASSASNFTVTLPASTGTTVLQNASNNLLMNSGYGSDAVAYGCRAWVNFNGQGTVAIRASGNVSSITDLGTGNYRVNFTTAMPNTNYACVVSTKQTDDASYNYVGVAFTQDFVTTYAEILCRPVATSDSKVDLQTISVSIFR
jgi:hypothetical protein